MLKLTSIALSALLAAAAQPVLAACPKDQVRIGWEPWAPYSVQENGEYTGLDLDIAKAVLADMGCNVEFVQRPWKRLLLEIEQGKVDMTASASRNAEREQYGFFSEPYRTESVVLFVGAGQSANYSNIQGLKDIAAADFDLGIARGYYYGEEYAALESDPSFKDNLQSAGDDVTNYKKLAAKRLDGFLADPFSAAASLKELGLSDKVEQHATIYSDDIYFLISRKSSSQAFVDAFNQSLSAMKADGRIQTIIDQYLN
ncbi:amino acid ABC transporter substrate-binding protein [Bacterioplanes sanyensis]|uniref:substrate-binding periplasmic protein n=1 Tax=Bacterioplanes sanyensis TaxID=1249553 RepID=UPI001673754A|nr:transporter substrate-binding domain-containing protein [Bacterioplanes sanyensis]GGY50274.1 amino acid ABC transporter substrate-binding protein [Bacterioplanes sanyensis]